jgi:hypothetical protein
MQIIIIIARGRQRNGHPGKELLSPLGEGGLPLFQSVSTVCEAYPTTY